MALLEPYSWDYTVKTSNLLTYLKRASLLIGSGKHFTPKTENF